MTEFVIRDAVADDGPRIAVVHHAGWRYAYTELLPADHWETDTVERRTGRWAQQLAAGDPVGWPRVAAVDGVVVGFAQAGPARTKHDLEPVCALELWSLYVAPEHHGTGAGGALLRACLPPDLPAQLWVAHPNPRAQAFYAKHGFTRDDAVFVDDHGITEIRMTRQ